jgi:hypothetical protein
MGLISALFMLLMKALLYVQYKTVREDCSMTVTKRTAFPVLKYRCMTAIKGHGSKDLGGSVRSHAPADLSHGKRPSEPTGWVVG